MLLFLPKEVEFGGLVLQDVSCDTESYTCGAACDDEDLASHVNQ